MKIPHHLTINMSFVNIYMYVYIYIYIYSPIYMVLCREVARHICIRIRRTRRKRRYHYLLLSAIDYLIFSYPQAITGQSLVHTMAWRLISAKPSPVLMLLHHKLHILKKLFQNEKVFIRKNTWKWVGHIVRLYPVKPMLSAINHVIFHPTYIPIFSDAKSVIRHFCVWQPVAPGYLIRIPVMSTCNEGCPWKSHSLDALHPLGLLK